MWFTDKGQRCIVAMPAEGYVTTNHLQLSTESSFVFDLFKYLIHYFSR